jgi:hypothetical protein
MMVYRALGHPGAPSHHQILRRNSMTHWCNQDRNEVARVWDRAPFFECFRDYPPWLLVNILK